MSIGFIWFTRFYFFGKF